MYHQLSKQEQSDIQLKFYLIVKYTIYIVYIDINDSF